MTPHLLRLVLALSLLAGFARAAAPGITCDKHPSNKGGKLKSVLIRAWYMPERTGSKNHDNAYLARHMEHAYAPDGDPRSKKYVGLDLFFQVFTSTRNHLPIRMYFQRRAKVHLFVDPDAASIRNRDSKPTPAFAGWKAEGWAKLVKGSSPLTYGIHQQWERSLPDTVFVFSKMSGGPDEMVQVPKSEDIVAGVKNIKIKGTEMNFWISEADGSASQPPGKFMGKVIRPNTRCPDKLHDEWFTFDDNKMDRDTRGVKFQTWHPAWDPCFWCAYDHEHGSSAKELMGYVPKYSYSAWKNFRQNEQHEGFKGFVCDMGKYLVYYNIHVTTSNIRRAKVRFHSINLVVVDKRTKELQYEISHKADFGFLAARRVNKVGFIPLNDEDRRIEQEQNANKDVRKLRSINVIDENNLRPDFQYRPQGLLVGAYEGWTTAGICMKANRFNPIAADVETPPTGIKAADKLDTEVKLGRFFKGKFIRNVGVNRSLRLISVELSSKHCNFTGGEKPTGYFYTDPNGLELRKRPGPDAIRQYIKPGFKLTFNNRRFETVDPWLGLYEEGVKGFFRDHGFGIDPARN